MYADRFKSRYNNLDETKNSEWNPSREVLVALANKNISKKGKGKGGKKKEMGYRLFWSKTCFIRLKTLFSNHKI